MFTFNEGVFDKLRFGLFYFTSLSSFHSPSDPWDWYIYLDENYRNPPNVGKYTSPMDAMGS